jgi:hypothetical protein
MSQYITKTGHQNLENFLAAYLGGVQLQVA